MQQVNIPESLQAKFSFYQKQFSNIEHPLKSALQILLLSSDYASRQIASLESLVRSENCRTALSYEAYARLANQLNEQVPSLFARSLRQFRHYHLLCLMLRELGGYASTQETMAAWSDCADALILRTLAFCQQEFAKRYGEPCNEAGEKTQLYVLAMGKLGGRELNYSSDIDLIFVFSEAGYTNGQEQLSNQQYYTKVVQLFVQLLQQLSPEGFVFRVDLRLRPNGDSGALVCSLAAIETYYQEQGRDWERYAMVKARLIGEKRLAPNHWFHRIITPFVYRRYVDFSVIESLRSMKSMIEREVQQNPMLDDIKRGFGGIREIEFIIQNIQLIRGGRIAQLRVQNAMDALQVLKEEGLLTRTGALQQAYLFLRKLENALQGQNDQQTHSLPKDELKQEQISLAMGCKSWFELVDRLQRYQRIVSMIFRSSLGQVEAYEDDNRLLAHQLASLWQGHIESTMAINLLRSLGFHNPEHCYQMLHAFRHAPRCRRLTQAARLRLDRFMLLLLLELTQVENTDAILLQVLHLLENIVGRSAYLALLTENPHVLKELFHWFANSPFITSLLVNQPFLLELLLDQGQNWRIPSRKQLEQTLKSRLAYCSESELQNESLRQFKLSNWFSAARAEMYRRYDAVRIGRFLADVAEVIVVEVLAISCQQLSERYPQIMQIKPQFTVIAYGKLGSREMNYNSDLDLVFIHSALPEEESLIIRLTQKMLHMLTTRSQAGVLYSVDTRLRPSGSAGLLVSHIDAFIHYQRSQAWTWEYQALLRARILTANKRVRLAFNQLKIDVLSKPRDKRSLRDEIFRMRAKIGRYSDANQVKYAVGGLLDLEFLVQFLVLAYPRLSFLSYTHTLSLLQGLLAEKILHKKQYSKLKQAYKHYHYLLHQSLLQAPQQNYELQQADVQAVSELLYGLDEE